MAGQNANHTWCSWLWWWNTRAHESDSLINCWFPWFLLFPLFKVCKFFCCFSWCMLRWSSPMCYTYCVTLLSELRVGDRANEIDAAIAKISDNITKINTNGIINSFGVRCMTRLDCKICQFQLAIVCMYMMSPSRRNIAFEGATRLGERIPRRTNSVPWLYRMCVCAALFHFKCNWIFRWIDNNIFWNVPLVYNTMLHAGC